METRVIVRGLKGDRAHGVKGVDRRGCGDYVGEFLRSFEIFLSTAVGGEGRNGGGKERNCL